MIASVQFFRLYIGCLSVNEWSSRRPWWSESASTVLFLSTSTTSTYLVDRTCAVHPVELYLFRMRSAVRQRSFAVNGPTIWNSVSSVLRAPGLSVTERFHTVTRTLKTQLFSTARHRWDVSTRFRRRIQMTYLVTYLLNNVITTCINFSYLTLFTRKLCERRWSLVVMCEDNDTCIGHRCVNNAQCKRIIGGYNCGPCPTGFAGLYCQRGDSSFSSQLSQCYSF